MARVILKNLKIQKVKIFASSFISEHRPVIISSKFSTKYRYLTHIYVNNEAALSFYQEDKNENEIKSVKKIFSKSKIKKNNFSDPGNRF